jgi:hypothetical protein
VLRFRMLGLEDDGFYDLALGLAWAERPRTSGEA